MSEGVLESLAPWNAFAEQSCPFTSDLLVHAVEEENESSLGWSGDREDNEEDRDDNFLWDKEHKITEDPGETDGDIDGDVDTELLLSVTLIRLGSSRKCFVDFTTNEEEKNSVGRDDDKSGDEESQEAKKIALNVAHVILLVVWNELSVLGSSTDSNTHSSSNSPASKMVPLLQQLSLSVSSHNHLVEIEGDTESPAEVCYEHEVQNDSYKYTSPVILCHIVTSRHDEGEETNTDTET